MKVILPLLLVVCMITTLVPLPIVSANTTSDSLSADLSLSSHDSKVYLTSVLTNTTQAANINYMIALVLYGENGNLKNIAFLNKKTTVENQINDELSIDIDSSTAFVKAFAWTGDLIPLCPARVIRNPLKPLKILAIGNSFSDDATRWIYDIAQDAGIPNIILGNLYYGGCTLAKHWEEASQNKTDYDYRKNSSATNGIWVTQSGKGMLYAIQDENWDIITLQQASGSSGVIDTYNSDLDNLITYVNAHKTNPSAKLVWHTTWAYAATSNHAEFPKYNSNQLMMYNSIINCVKNKIVTNDAFSNIIPVGTAIQNVRTSYIGDILNRDGYHLTYNLGRYIAGLTWFRELTGLSINNVTFLPNDTQNGAIPIPQKYLPIVKKAVNAAIKKPFEITPLGYISDPDTPTDPSYPNYNLLNWQPRGTSFWNSSQGCTLVTSTTDGLYLKYVSSKMFTKAEIPNGSIIVIDAGYQYRPDGWTDLTITTSNRPGNITTNIVTVDDAWWGNFNYRAFNISKNPASDISNAVQETASHFRIYIPK